MTSTALEASGSTTETAAPTPTLFETTTIIESPVTVVAIEMGTATLREIKTATTTTATE